jgi:K+-sensing histidine kinase KdpD
MDRILIAVEDDGGGVLDEDDIFSGFARDGRDAVVSGSVGLGLAVARSMAQHMGGDLAYNRISDVNIFTFDLPAAPEVEDDSERYIELVDDAKVAR